MPRYSYAFLLLTLFIAACSPAAQNTANPTLAPVEATATQLEVQPTAQPEAQPSPTQESAALPPTQAVAVVPTAQESVDTAPRAAQAAAYNGPAWASLPLVDARTGATFTLADYAGKTVYVEPMATWCTNCRRQLPNVETARAQLNADQYVFIGLSVAENVDNATLAGYVTDNGWNFSFAVATEALTQGMIDTFGRTAVTPPSTPHFIIRPDGSVTDIMTGMPSADEIIAELRAASGA